MTKSQDPLWGIRPCNRFNVDQVPLSFAYDSGTTWDKKGVKRVWCKAPNKGLTKRQLTAQVLISPQNVPNVSLIFRGGGKVFQKEKHLYAQQIPVLFQKKAWADRQLTMEWARTIFKPHIERYTEQKEEKLLICDSLDSQVQREFIDYMKKECNTIVIHGPPKFTDSWQPVDAGVGALLQHYVAQQYDNWVIKKMIHHF